MPISKTSFRDTLVGPQQPLVSYDIVETFDPVFANLNQSSSQGTKECPVITVSKEEYFDMCKPWFQALGIKSMVQDRGYAVIRERIMQMWKPKGNITMKDIGNGFYVLQFTNS